MTSEPTTAAGRALLAWADDRFISDDAERAEVVAQVVAIEAEATAATALAAEKDRVRRLREALEAVVTGYYNNERLGDIIRQIKAALAETADTAPAEPQPFDEADNMCPNCVTPWKCNGPHLSEQTAAAKRAEPPGVAAAEDLARRSRAPAEPRWPSGEVLAEALHRLHTTELWHWWEPQPDGGAIVRKGTSPEFAAAILAALHPGDAG